MLRSKLVISLWLASLVLAPIPSRAEEPLAHGKIVDRVVCRSDPSKSYALYVPSSYRPDRTWPILYCFDPDMRFFRDREVTVVFSVFDEQGGWIDDAATAPSDCT